MTAAKAYIPDILIQLSALGLKHLTLEVRVNPVNSATITMEPEIVPCPDCLGIGSTDQGQTNWCQTCRGYGKVGR